MSKGRGNSDSITVNQTLKVNIDWLIKKKVLVKGARITSLQSWTNGSAINLECSYTQDQKEIRLFYKIGETLIDYRIQIAEMKSNLGKGVNLFFVCPVLHTLCKNIYLCYGSDIFKSFQAYNKRIYYSTQICSKEYRTVAQSFNEEKKLDKLQAMRQALDYKGKPTKRGERLKRIREKYYKLEELKMYELEEYLNRRFGIPL